MKSVARRPGPLGGDVARDVVSVDGAAPESNRPSRGLHDRTGFEDLLGHRARAAPRPAYMRVLALLQADPAPGTHPQEARARPPGGGALIARGRAAAAVDEEQHDCDRHNRNGRADHNRAGVSRAGSVRTRVLTERWHDTPPRLICILGDTGRREIVDAARNTTATRPAAVPRFPGFDACAPRPDRPRRRGGAPSERSTTRRS